MSKEKNPGEAERARLRAEPGDRGKMWRLVYGANEAEYEAMLAWEESRDQSRRPHRFVKKYRPGQSPK